MAGSNSKRDQINVRLSDEGIAILYALLEHFGISQAAIFEMLLRDRARKEALTVNPLVHAPSGTARSKSSAASSSRPGTWGHSRSESDE